MELVPLLRRLSEASGMSGYEAPVREIVLQEFGRFSDTIHVDTLGNVIARRNGTGPQPRPSILLAAHMDEIGMVVSETEKGYIHFQQRSYDDRVLLGQEVMVHGRKDLPGIIGARPPHLLLPSEADKPIPHDRLLIDVGLLPEELIEWVRVGDLITMRRDLVELKGGMVSGKALDDRAAVAAVALCLEELSHTHHYWDVYAVATVQEEEGMKGAITSTYGLQPDLGIAIDVTWAKQPGAPDEYTYELGKGPTIGCGPNFHPKFQDALLETARSIEMSVHLEPAARPPGTDAHAIQVSRAGIPAALVSIPQRNMHTPVETVSLRDVERVGRLLAAFVGRLDGSFLDTLAWDLGLDEVE